MQLHYPPVKRWTGLALLVLVLMAIILAVLPVHARSDIPVMALYYTYFNMGNWTYDGMSDIPAPKYSSGSHDAMNRHIEQAHLAGIDTFVCNWRGPDDQTDGRCRSMQKRIASSDYDDIRIAFMIELMPDSDEDLFEADGMAEALRKLEDLIHQRSYMRFAGKPLLIFVNPVYFGDTEAWRRFRNQVDLYRSQYWMVASTIPAQQDDMFRYLDVFDATFSFEINGDPYGAMNTYAARLQQYNATHQDDGPFIATVMPGFDNRRSSPQGMYVDRNNGMYYQRSWEAAKQHNPAAIILNSFNNFYEGTHIEPSEVYGTGYLGLTRDLVSNFYATRPVEQRPSVYFPETGHYLQGAFLSFWQQNGGLGRFGYPITEEYIRDEDGKVVQYFERARFELRVVNGQAVVDQGLMGKEYADFYDVEFSSVAPIANTSTQRYFPETGHTLQGYFKTYWENNGRLAFFGYPISEQLTVELSDGQNHLVQYFERVRMEQHGNTILLGRLGIDLAPCKMLAPWTAGAPPAEPLEEVESDPCAEYFYDSVEEARQDNEQVELPASSSTSTDPATADLGEGLEPQARGRVYPQVVEPNTVQGFEAWDYLPGEEVSLWFNLPDGTTRGLPYVATADENGYVLIGIQTRRTDPVGDWSLVGKGITSGRVVVAPFRLQWN